MTDVEKRKAEARLADEKLAEAQQQQAEAKRRETEAILREAFGRLSTDQSLPILQIIDGVLSSELELTSNNRVSNFAERLVHQIEINSK